MPIRLSLKLSASALAACLGFSTGHATGVSLVRVDGVIGSSIVYQLQGDPFEVYALLPSFTTGPTPLAILDPNDPRLLGVGTDLLLFMKVGVLGPTGAASRSYPVPPDPSLHGIPIYAQCITLPGPLYFTDDISNVPSFKLGLKGQSTFSLTEQAEDPDGHTVTLLDDGRVLIGGGSVTVGAGLVTVSDKLALFDPQTQKFTPAGTLVQARSAHTATLLADGRVLMLGGFDQNDVVLAGGEIWNPATGISTATAGMSSPRSQHSATLLADGRVYVAGGVSQLILSDPVATVNSALKSTETYAPAGNSWTPGPDLPKPRLWHGASLTGDDRVLITGGVEITSVFGLPVPGVVNDCRIYDPVGNGLSAAANFSGNRATHAQVRLGNGDVAVVGGADGNILAGQVNPISTCRVYHHLSNTWSNVASMGELRARLQLLSAGGMLYAVGGVETFDLISLSGNPVPEIEVAPEALTSWAVTGSLTYPRQQATAAAIENGLRIFVNGTAMSGSGATFPDKTAEVYIP